MTVKTEPLGTGAHLLSESDGFLSRETVTIASGAGALVAGTVLGKITTGGKYVAYDNAASDGSQVAAGVLFAAVDATSADVPAVAHVRLCEVISARLTWKAGLSGGDKTAGLADLAGAYVIAR